MVSRNSVLGFFCMHAAVYLYITGKYHYKLETIIITIYHYKTGSMVMPSLQDKKRGRDRKGD